MNGLPISKWSRALIDIAEKLRRTSERDYGFAGKWTLPVNPDGPKAADYIDNVMTHMGHVLHIAFEHIQDNDVREELRRHAYAAWRGTK